MLVRHNVWERVDSRLTVFSIARLMQLEQQWRQGLCFMKIDVEKAFDTLDRKAFLARLSQKLGHSEVLRCWWTMFETTEATLSTVWGESVIDMVTGIRQGSVESPQMFAAVIDWVLQDVAAKYGWNLEQGPLQGLRLGEIAFVDDLIAWEGNLNSLSRKMSQLAAEMRLWGLRVNAHKSQVYVSPYNKDVGEVTLEGNQVKRDDHLLVMGMPFRVGITVKEALAPLFAKVKSKFWAMKHLFRAKVPLSGRLKLMDKVLGNTALWCAAAFQPDKLTNWPSKQSTYSRVNWSSGQCDEPNRKEKIGWSFAYGASGRLAGLSNVFAEVEYAVAAESLGLCWA